MALPLVDLSEERSRQVIVDREADRYLGQPDTVLLEDGGDLSRSAAGGRDVRGFCDVGGDV